jgi:hypothetical protein
MNTQNESASPDSISDHTLDKALDVLPEVPDEAKVKPEPTHEEIEVVAHQIYEEKGRIKGSAETNWEAAEGRLKGETFNGV